MEPSTYVAWGAKSALKANSIEDAALGCVLGAFVGDALGAKLEFLGRID